MAEEPFAEYLDRLIQEQYVERRLGVGYMFHSPLHSAVVEYLEDTSTGRPVPIDDSAEHYLLRKFDITRRNLLPAPIPAKNGFQGEVRGRYGTWVVPKEQPYYTNEIHNEIPWRCYHGDLQWPCTECGHPESEHRSYEDGWHYCIGDDGECNCGNNIGR